MTDTPEGPLGPLPPLREDDEPATAFGVVEGPVRVYVSSAGVVVRGPRKTWSYSRVGKDDLPELDDAYYDEVRRAVGRGAPTVLLGTSKRSLERSLARIRDAERGASGPEYPSVPFRRTALAVSVAALAGLASYGFSTGWVAGLLALAVGSFLTWVVYEKFSEAEKHFRQRVHGSEVPRQRERSDDRE